MTIVPIFIPPIVLPVGILTALLDAEIVATLLSPNKVILFPEKYPWRAYKFPNPASGVPKEESL